MVSPYSGLLRGMDGDGLTRSQVAQSPVRPLDGGGSCEVLSVRAGLVRASRDLQCSERGFWKGGGPHKKTAAGGGRRRWGL